MKKLLLQHWTGNIDELGKLSTANMSEYAKKIGVDYKLLLGNVFHPTLSAPCQKIHMLNEEFDEYDMVVMTDMDMFTRKDIDKNIFTDTTGIGWHGPIQDNLVKNLEKRFPKLGNPKYPYWGGSTYRLDRETRKTLRNHIKENEIIQFNNNLEDEGIMHRLAVLAEMKITNKTYFPSYHWNAGSFYHEQMHDACFIHIRTKISPSGPKRTKIENYRDLVNRGII